jgi:hypothetical protein
LTSHFADNKVTLYDFQLAENMNQSYKITLKEYTAYPWVNDRTLASWKIYFGWFFISMLLFNYGYYWGDQYLPASRRKGGRIEDMLPSPLTIRAWELDVNEVEKLGADRYAEDKVDEYALKTSLFKSNGVF